MAQYFNGKFLVQPQASVAVDDKRLANLNPTAANTLALVGPSTGGIPQTAVLLTDPNQARRVLRSGDLLDAALLAFDPSSQTGGASQIYVSRVNSAIAGKGKIYDIVNPVKASAAYTFAGTPAAGNVVTLTIAGVIFTYTLQGGDTVGAVAGIMAGLINNSTNAVILDPLTGVTAAAPAAILTITARLAGVDGNAITVTTNATGGGITVTAGTVLAGGTGNTLCSLTADDYGLYTNSIYYQIANATGGKGYKFTIGVTSGDVVGGSIVQDNLYRDLLTIQYLPAGTSTLVVNDTSMVITCSVGADSVTIPFNTFTTVQAVADYLNAQAGKYQVTVIGSNGVLPSAAAFDPASALDIKTTSKTLTGNLAALVEFLNNPVNPFCSATRKTNPVTAVPYLNSNGIFLTGGSDGTTTFTDWSNAINALQLVEAYVVVPVTDDASVHAAVATHVDYMSNQGRKPRIAVVGGALSEYVSTAAVPTGSITTRAINLGSKRVVLASPGVTVYDSKGVKVTKSAAFTAAMVGGMLAAVAQGTPLTHKWFSNVLGLEVNFSIADKDALLLGGVCPIEYVSGRGYRIVQSKTTWNGAPNYGKNEISVVAAIDAVVRRVQDTLDEQLVGQKVAPETLMQAISITETVLSGSYNDGFLVGDSKNKPFKNISASADGDTIRIQFEMSPAIPANYILISVTAIPWTGTAN